MFDQIARLLHRPLNLGQAIILIGASLYTAYVMDHDLAAAFGALQRWRIEERRSGP